MSRNAFVGCRGGAILLEPDDRVHYANLAEAVDTQVRLIDRNRFDILGVAIRSTLGAVRVEKNDVRVRPLPASFVPTDSVVNLFTSQVFTLPTFVERSDDQGHRQPATRGQGRLAPRCRQPRRDQHRELRRAGEVEHPRRARDRPGRRPRRTTPSCCTSSRWPARARWWPVGRPFTLAPLITDLEAFVVNLSGAQNELTDNNLLSKNTALDGGVVLQVPSGSVTGNEIEVGHVAVMITAKASQGRRDLAVEGNRLTATGAQSGRRAARRRRTRSRSRR